MKLTLLDRKSRCRKRWSGLNDSLGIWCKSLSPRRKYWRFSGNKQTEKRWREKGHKKCTSKQSKETQYGWKWTIFYLSVGFYLFFSPLSCMLPACNSTELVAHKVFEQKSSFHNQAKHTEIAASEWHQGLANTKSGLCASDICRIKKMIFSFHRQTLMFQLVRHFHPQENERTREIVRRVSNCEIFLPFTGSFEFCWFRKRKLLFLCIMKKGEHINLWGCKAIHGPTPIRCSVSPLPTEIAQNA